MGHKVPLSVKGNCGNCAFSVPLAKNHYQKKFHTLTCKRFPPVGASVAPGHGPWSLESFVHDYSYCAEWKQE